MAAVAKGMALGPYWQGNGVRPASFGTAPAGVSGMSASRTGAPPAVAWPGRSAALAAAAGPYAAAAPGFASGLAANPVEIDGFVEQLRPMLVEAGRQLGVSPRILLAHAALETDWGRAVVGNNLFGIKAGGLWQGAAVTTMTHEVEGGSRVPREAAFRAYPSLDASVQDYVALIEGTQRYRGLVGLGDDAAAYGRGLIAGGYASDTDYARKLAAFAADPAAASAFPAIPSARFTLFGTR
jgi:flagellar protein FlgJ